MSNVKVTKNRKEQTMKTADMCAHNNDGSVTTMMCPQHADQDPCYTTALVTGRRRKGSIVNGVCSSCGWTDSTAKGFETRQDAIEHLRAIS